MLFIFDMGGVVTTTFGADNQMYSRLGLTRDDFFSICKMNNNDIWELYEKGKISTKEFWDSYNKRVSSLQRELFEGILDVKSIYKINPNLDIKNLNFAELDLFSLCFHPELNEKTAKIIIGLRKKHRVVCGTNTIESHLKNHMERGDYALFDQTYASNVIGLSKPDKLFWQTIMDFEGYKPEETFFTDDREDNCKAAGECGINVHQFTDAEDLIKAWSKYL